MADFRSYRKFRGRGLDTRKLNIAIGGWIADERMRMSTHGQVRQRVVREIMEGAGLSRCRAGRLYKSFVDIGRAKVKAIAAGSTHPCLLHGRSAEIQLTLRAEARYAAARAKLPPAAVTLAYCERRPSEGEKSVSKSEWPRSRFELSVEPFWARPFPWQDSDDLDHAG